MTEARRTIPPERRVDMAMGFKKFIKYALAIEDDTGPEWMELSKFFVYVHCSGVRPAANFPSDGLFWAGERAVCVRHNRFL